MGLKGGKDGAKAQLRERCPGAFRVFDSLSECRDGVLPDERDADDHLLTKRQQTVVLGDGNVMLMQIPESACSIEAFSDILFSFVRDLVRSGRIAILVFDEPEAMTWAKREEQQRRDAARSARTVTASADIDAQNTLPKNFSSADLETFHDVHLLKSDRKLRMRLYDEAARRVFLRIKDLMSVWKSSGHDAGVLILDGVDIRGCGLADDEKREPSIVGTDSRVVADFERSAKIGEGDLKLIAIENRLRELISSNERYADYRLCLTSTVDTDSLPIMMLDVAKRRTSPYRGALHSLFCMRTPPTKRAREEDCHVSSTYLCTDIALLEGLVQQHLWSSTTSKPTPDEMLNAMLAFASACALCGCDFTLEGLKGSRFDHFYESFPTFIRDEPDALRGFGATLARESAVARRACSGLQKVCATASAAMSVKKRYLKQSKSVSEVSETLLLRALWTCAYWSQVERRADDEWGFFSYTVAS